MLLSPAHQEPHRSGEGVAQSGGDEGGVITPRVVPLTLYPSEDGTMRLGLVEAALAVLLLLSLAGCTGATPHASHGLHVPSAAITGRTPSPCYGDVWTLGVQMSSRPPPTSGGWGPC